LESFGPLEAPPIESKTDDSALSPRVGLLYHPVPWLGLYASYVEGFNAENTGVDQSGAPLDPRLSHQYEAGLKAEGLDGRLSASLAFFDLTQENISTPIPGMPGRFDVTGEARNRGIELDISGALTDHWRLIASYAYIDSEITKDRDSEGGTRNQGNRLRNVPRHAGSFWTQYDFGGFGWPELTAGAGVFLVGQREGNNANNFQLPGHGRVDALLGYSWRIGPTRLTAQFNVENLLDKEYFASTSFGSRLNILPGAPRTFLGSVQVEW
ncbi:MAG: TonB-dependent siderophore receptor, partial [Gammaproteobacteria bacterium]